MLERKEYLHYNDVVELDLINTKIELRVLVMTRLCQHKRQLCQQRFLKLRMIPV